MHHSSIGVENTLSTISHSSLPTSPALVAADELVLLIECDRPDAGSTRHRLGEIDEVVIGRGSQRELERIGRRLMLRVPDGRISTAHARVARHDGAFYVEDAGSKNGVSVNGARISRQLLCDGDIIECGRTLFVFRLSRRRPGDEANDLELAPTDALTVPGRLTLHEPLAAQLRALDDVARSSIPVLILGPSGSGKELIARAVHALSLRKGPFVGVNCGALAEGLVEAELFGSRRGAFTGAADDRPGLVRTADEGTLVLDEIGDLPLRAQPTLLRTLQEREVLPIGATRPVPVDVRLVAATHHDLDALVRQQQFRADLLARISGFVINVPPLRERLDDLGLLIAILLRRHLPRNQPTPTISTDAMRVLLRHDWPLNIRELEHCLRAALALALTAPRIEVSHLPESVRNPGARRPPLLAVPTRPMRPLTPEQLVVRSELRRLLIESKGNISQVARVMRKDRVQIRRWIRLFGLAADEAER